MPFFTTLPALTIALNIGLIIGLIIALTIAIAGALIVTFIIALISLLIIVLIFTSLFLASIISLIQSILEMQTHSPPTPEGSLHNSPLLTTPPSLHPLLPQHHRPSADRDRRDRGASPLPPYPTPQSPPTRRGE